MRLLTEEELKAINDAMPSDAKYGDVFKAVAEAQRDLTHKETLKAVGEWLNERVMCEHLAYYHRRFTCEGCINQLLRDEMPEEVKD